MDQESITKGILSGIVSQYIGEIARDPNRSIRKLVDMAERTSDGPTQKICYQMMQQMAADQSSPYYEMIHHLVTNTNSQTIKQFGINLGHNAWTFGSGNIRRINAQSSIAVSWAMMIDRTKTENRIPFSTIQDLVRRGREKEVYAWLLMTSKAIDEWEQYTGLFRKHSDCVFGLIADPDALTEELLEECAEIPNLMILVNTDAADWRPCTDRLSKSGFLYSAFRHIQNEEQIKEILSGSWLEELVPYHPLMAFTMAGSSLPHHSAQMLKEYMWNTRLDQVYPVLPVDLISDFVIINRLVTDRELLYRIEPDGSVSVGKELQFESSVLTCAELFS